MENKHSNAGMNTVSEIQCKASFTTQPGSETDIRGDAVATNEYNTQEVLSTCSEARYLYPISQLCMHRILYMHVVICNYHSL